MSAVLPRFISKVRIILEMIKFEHTVFAMPFALTSMMLAANGMPKLAVFGWIIAAMVGARSAAMAFNRIVDARLDKMNPRTTGRALPMGAVKTAEAWFFTLMAIGLFVFAAWSLNQLAFLLSPVALLVILGYSYTKRFTSLSHLILGLALGIAPVGAWIAVTGRLEFPPMILSASVIFWTAGFDIIYALQDLEFDAKMGLFSIPKALGPACGLFVSRMFHVFTALLLAWFGLALHLGMIYFAGVVFAACLMAYEQTLVKPGDYSKVNMAFFNTNGMVSIGFLLFTLADLLIRKT